MDRIEILTGPGGAGISKDDWEWFKRQVETAREPVADLAWNPPRFPPVIFVEAAVAPVPKVAPQPDAGLLLLTGLLLGAGLHFAFRKWVRSPR